ncbi:Vanillin dehydrogenase [Colletotrichum acutatum]
MINFTGSTAVGQIIAQLAGADFKFLLSELGGKAPAILVCGDPNVTDKTNTRLRPIIVSNINPGTEIYMTESFGPMVSVIEFETDEDALAVANDTEYGLSSAIFSRDLRRASRLAKKIEKELCTSAE